MALPRTAEVVVVGGGAIGASVLWHLSDLGVRDVVLLEKATLGSGSTSRSAGGIRQQFADELNVRIMTRSVPAFESFDERFNTDIGFRQPGYLMLIDAQHQTAFDDALEVQRALGVLTQRLSVEQVVALVPQIDPDGLVGATFNPRDGYASPEAVVLGYAQAAHARGARIAQSCAVTDIEVRGNRVQAVVTDQGRIATSVVVCAAGVGSAAVGRMVGVDLPVRAQRQWLHYSPGDCGLPMNLPLTVDFATGVYLHREGPGLLLGGRESSLDELAERATARLPVLEHLEVQASWSGDYEMSPDHNAMVGGGRDPEGFFYATGFSGHGFQQCPAVGEHLAERILGTEPIMDLASLSVERFAAGSLRTEAFVI